MIKSWIAKLKSVYNSTPKNTIDLMNILKQATKDGLLEPNTFSMLEGVLDVQETRVTDVMVPRPQMTTLSSEMDLKQIIAIVVESGHSRFPILGENKDEVIGIILAKDLLDYALSTNEKIFMLDNILRPAVFIPESKRLNVLLQDFRLNRSHIAMVVDEYGRITGLITIEDVLEQIVGEISDEHDTDDTPAIKPLPDGVFTVKALTSVEEFNEYFSSNLEADNIETIGGLVTRAFGHLPKRGENIKIDGFYFTVLRSDNRRIIQLSVTQEVTHQ